MIYMKATQRENEKVGLQMQYTPTKDRERKKGNMRSTVD